MLAVVLAVALVFVVVVDVIAVEAAVDLQASYYCIVV